MSLPSRSHSSDRPPGWFATTRWSMVVRAGDDQDATLALEELCRAYWRPLYEYARRTGASQPDSEDLTQGFFAMILRSGALARVNRERGRFRSYLLVAFRNFIFESHRKSTAAKRGGGVREMSLDELPGDSGGLADPNHTPDREFDRAWAITMLENVLECLAAEYHAAGRSSLFQEISPHLSAGKNPDCDAIGQRLGMSAGAAAVAIHRMRKRYGVLLRAAVADTVADASEVDDELRHLIRIVSESPASGTLG